MVQGGDIMNTTELLSNATWRSGNVSLSSVISTIITSTSSPLPPSSSSTSSSISTSSPVSHPELTIMVVLGLSLLLAGVAAFLAACRPSGDDGDSDTSCGPVDGLTRGRGGSTEPQLKVWKRLGSYRRSYNLSFRRPPPRRTQDRVSAHAASQSPGRQTPQSDAAVEPSVTTPCLFDYVTEI